MSQPTQNTEHLMQLPAQTSVAYPNISLPAAISLFRQLRKSVYAKRPMLKEILHKHGSLSLYNFTKSHITTQPYARQERKEQFITILTQSIQSLLGTEVSTSVAQQVREYSNIITADHHGPLGYQGFVTSNLLESMTYQEINDAKLKNIIVLSCANISFDNYSFPRGLQFHSYSQNKIYDNQLVFFPRKARPCPVVYFPAYSPQDIQNAKKRLDMWSKEHIVRKKKLKNFIPY